MPARAPPAAAIFNLPRQIAGVAVAHGVAQIFAAQELHHHEGPVPLVFAEIVNAEDVVVGDAAGHARFGQKSLFDLGVLAAGLGQNLDGHGAPDERIESAVDVRHPTAQEFLKLILADSRGKLHCKGLSYQRRELSQRGNVAGSYGRRLAHRARLRDARNAPAS